MKSAPSLDDFKAHLQDINTGPAVASLSLPGGQDQKYFLNHHLFSCSFSHFSSNFLHFLPHFGLPGGRLAHPGRSWLCHCINITTLISELNFGILWNFTFMTMDQDQELFAYIPYFNVVCCLSIEGAVNELRASEWGTPLNNPPIEIHANSSMFGLIFWPHVTMFCIFWLHECLKWILEFNSKSLFWCQSRQIFEVRVIEQRHHEFQLIHMPPHQFWPRYHSDGLSPVHVRFEFFLNRFVMLRL